VFHRSACPRKFPKQNPAAEAEERAHRRAYRLDVQHFMRTVGIRTVEELRQADRKAMIARELVMREGGRAAASTILRRSAALSSLF
jgi:integrase/recombinase XerD